MSNAIGTKRSANGGQGGSGKVRLHGAERNMDASCGNLNASCMQVETGCWARRQNGGSSWRSGSERFRSLGIRSGILVGEFCVFGLAVLGFCGFVMCAVGGYSRIIENCGFAMPRVGLSLHSRKHWMATDRCAIRGSGCILWHFFLPMLRRGLRLQCKHDSNFRFCETGDGL